MIENININSNIRLHYIPLTKLKTTTMGVYIHRSLNKQDAPYNALLPFVLKRGCAVCPDTEATAKYLENLYGAKFGAAVMKRGEDHIMYFDAEVISDRYAPQNEKLLSALTKLLLSVLFAPVTENGAFKADFTEQEKNNAADRIEAVKNDKRTYASDRCSEEMCRDSAFAISQYGTKEGIAIITAQSLYEYYKRIITASFIDIYVCGDADISEIKNKISETVSGMTFEKADIPRTEILKSSSGVKNVTEEMDVMQGKLSIGFTTDTKPTDSDYTALTVMNSVFGSGAHSKLFNNVREKLSLAYYASSQLEKYKGLLIVNSGIEFKNFERAYNETLAQLENIKNGDISDEEFESSINALLNSLESLKDDQRMMQNFYLGEEVIGITADIEDKKAAIKKVTKEDIQHAAQKLKLNTVYFLTGKEEK